MKRTRIFEVCRHCRFILVLFTSDSLPRAHIAMTSLVAAELSLNPDTSPPSFWMTHSSKQPEDGGVDYMLPGWGAPTDGKVSKYYHYPDAVFSDTISTSTREWLRACWTNVGTVRTMLQSGIDVQTANTNGFTGLHMAASRFKTEIAEVLLDAGHDVNVQDVNGETPLDYCIDFGQKGEGGNRLYEEMVLLLESHGAVRQTELSWLTAYNTLKYAPNI